MFWDSVEIEVKGGKGGDGAVSLRTSRGESKGGPDGGDGGDGGSVVIRADHNLNTLGDYARQEIYQAPSGEPGKKGKRHGKSAEDLILSVPVGTLVIAEGKTVADLTETGQSAVVAHGGRGGFGNAHFTAAHRQAPRHAELGEPGIEKRLRLELKLVADLGLVGVPSVGKSTLLSRLSAARPKIADYPFTTTVPQLGIASVDNQTVLVADIPGLVAGAHAGKGLGDTFLRHIERTKVIIHMLDATSADPVADYLAIRHELESFSPALVGKPEIIVLNKADALDEELKKLVPEDVAGSLGRSVRLISAVSGEGLTDLLREGNRQVASRPDPVARSGAPVFTLAELAPQAVSVEHLDRDDEYVVRGARIEQLARQTDFANAQATARFWWILQRFGAVKQLEKRGAGPASKLTVAGKKIPWQG